MKYVELVESILAEKFVNLFPAHNEDKAKYANEVYELLQTAYKEIGGLQGSGFNSPEEMVEKIPFWKLNIKDGKVIAVVMYKDKDGRKVVALGTDNSVEGIRAVRSAIKQEMKRSYFEISGRVLSSFMKIVGFDELKDYLVPVEDVSEYIKKDVKSIDEFGEGNLNADDKFMLKKFPELRPYYYIRSIGGEPHMKVIGGTKGKKINF